VSHGSYETIAADWLQSRTLLLWGAASSALAFFLASFQVHEKSLLLALVPISFLWTEDPTFCEWFSIVTAWTLWPLMQLDRLQTAYFCTMLIFGSFLQLQKLIAPSSPRRGFFERNAFFRWIPTLSYAAMIALHILEIVVVAPDHLPDLFEVLWNIVGCGFCCLAWLITCWHLFDGQQPVTVKQSSLKQKLS
jgi:alpha-1,3-glucosyltransferase